MNQFLIDNSNNNKLSLKINEFIETEGLTEICIATGYWDIKGTALITKKLQSFLKKKDTCLKIIVGDQPKANIRELEKIAFKKFIDLEETFYKNPFYQDACKLLLDFCKNDKIQIRLHQKDCDMAFLHAKCYIFKSKCNNSKTIIGSGNFTEMGLENNDELNIIDYDSSHIYNLPIGYNSWFNQKWNESKPWNKGFLIKLSKSKIGMQVAKERKDKFNDLISSDCELNNKEKSETILYYKSHDIDAVCIEKNNKFIIQKGSKVKIGKREACRTHITADRNKYANLINSDGILLKDICFGTSSRAISFVCFGSRSKADWKILET